MCCDPSYTTEEIEKLKVGTCPDCDCSPIDKDGNSLDVCHYSPEECSTCGWRPCDLSC